jgi:aromatic-L-amino-acid decarboxylase
MGTVLDCSLLYVRDPDSLIRVMSTAPSHLRSTAGGAPRRGFRQDSLLTRC